MKEDRGVGVRLLIGSDNWCPVCRGLFKSKGEKESLKFDGDHVAYLHADCKEIFFQLMHRIKDYEMRRRNNE